MASSPIKISCSDGYMDLCCFAFAAKTQYSIFDKITEKETLSDCEKHVGDNDITIYDTDIKEKNSIASSENLSDLKMKESGSFFESNKKVEDNDKEIDEIYGTANTYNNSFIEIIPDEVMLFIFSFFNIEQLCNKVAPVCRRWYTLANDPSLWLKLDLSFDAHSNQNMFRIIEKSPHLLSLKLSSSENGSDLLKAVAKNCCRLKELTIRFCEGLTKDIIEIMVANLFKLELLIVEGTTIHSPDCYPLLGKLKCLRHLDLSYSKFLEDNGLIAIAEQCEHLQYLNIDYISYINDVSVMRLIELRGSSLTHLYLDGEQMTDRGFHALSSCMNLKHLGISFCEEMTDYGLLGVKGLSNLTWLKLRKGCRLTAHGLSDLFSGGKLSRLTHVNLSECTELNDSVIISLSKKCLGITNLCLHWCWEVTDVGVTELVQNCRHIRVLDLTGMVRITGAPQFKSINSYLPNLTVLNLEQCNSIDDTIIRQLVCDKPSLKVIDYYGDQFISINQD
ncbi:unnamed protein product, partial [Meganyctiphanes norvegica]